MDKNKVIAVITLADVIREVAVFGACLIIAIALNAYAIVHYQTEWSELYTEFGFVLTLALILYVARCVVKALILVLWKCVKLLRRKMKR
ncbi:MAG: hypothetical protein J6B41_07800 [Alistipes sp.]|nr:hypothetical protein [Alistipes sp.]